MVKLVYYDHDERRSRRRRTAGVRPLDYGLLLVLERL